MNLIAKIKRLEAEAAERDKRIAALESKVWELQACCLPTAFVRDGGEYLDEGYSAAPMTTIKPAPKKRKTRAKTSGTE